MHRWAVSHSLSSDSRTVQGRNWILSSHSNLGHLHKTLFFFSKNRNRSAPAQFQVLKGASPCPPGIKELFFFSFPSACELSELSRGHKVAEGRNHGVWQNAPNTIRLAKVDKSRGAFLGCAHRVSKLGINLSPIGSIWVFGWRLF